jgi:outer membrane receptor protein involved in Fe transport
MESWMVAHADVDLRVGGLLRTNHDPDGRIGDPRTTINRILAITPKRRFSLQLTETPEGFPLGGMLEGTWYQITLDPVGKDQTLVRCEGHGFQGGPMGYAARAFVDRGNAWALEQLEKTVLARRAHGS